MAKKAFKNTKDYIKKLKKNNILYSTLYPLAQKRSLHPFCSYDKYKSLIEQIPQDYFLSFLQLTKNGMSIQTLFQVPNSIPLYKIHWENEKPYIIIQLQHEMESYPIKITYQSPYPLHEIFLVNPLSSFVIEIYKDPHIIFKDYLQHWDQTSLDLKFVRHVPNGQKFSFVYNYRYQILLRNEAPFLLPLYPKKAETRWDSLKFGLIACTNTKIHFYIPYAQQGDLKIDKYTYIKNKKKNRKLIITLQKIAYKFYSNIYFYKYGPLNLLIKNWNKFPIEKILAYSNRGSFQIKELIYENGQMNQLVLEYPNKITLRFVNYENYYPIRTFGSLKTFKEMLEIHNLCATAYRHLFHKEITSGYSIKSTLNTLLQNQEFFETRFPFLLHTEEEFYKKRYISLFDNQKGCFTQTKKLYIYEIHGFEAYLLENYKFPGTCVLKKEIDIENDNEEFGFYLRKDKKTKIEKIIFSMEYNYVYRKRKKDHEFFTNGEWTFYKYNTFTKPFTHALERFIQIYNTSTYNNIFQKIAFELIDNIGPNLQRADISYKYITSPTTTQLSYHKLNDKKVIYFDKNSIPSYETTNKNILISYTLDSYKKMVINKYLANKNITIENNLIYIDEPISKSLQTQICPLLPWTEKEIERKE